ncbi:MAG: hypothetical protein HY360_04100 [Verrucomicrobia bacterium]|nr:hypothetical protein [Verrucomicrobiota bacterium]
MRQPLSRHLHIDGPRTRRPMKPWRVKLIPSFAALDVAGAVCLAAYAILAAASYRTPEAPLNLFLGAMAAAWMATLAIWVFGRNHPEILSPKRVLIWALLFRGVGLAGAPLLEDDYARYLWDGRMFALTGSPYGWRPIDFFQDPNVPAPFHRILDQINHPDLPTIYSPMCQYAFLLSHKISPGSLLPLKIILLLADLLTWRFLVRLASPAGVFLYAWCPLLIKETMFTAHIDSLGIYFLTASLYALKNEKPGQAAVWLAAAVETKAFALILAPFILSGVWRRALPLFLGTLAVLRVPFLAQGAWGEAATLKVFARSWEFNSSLYGLQTWILGGPAARLCALAALAAGCLLLWKHQQHRNHPFPRGDWILGLFFLLSPVVNPWYLLWMLPFACVFPSAWIWAWLATVSLSYIHGLHLAAHNLAAYEHPLWVRPAEYGIVLIAFLWDWFSYRRR